MDIRPAESGDAARIAEIYAHYVTNTVATYDTEPPAVEEWERRLRAAHDGGWPVLVGREDGRVVGYALMSQWLPKPGYRYTAEDSIYLDPASVGAGRGRALLQSLLERARAAGIRQVIALIADTGSPASRSLHQALGFRLIGRLTRVGFKHGRWIDVDLLQLELAA